MERLAYCWFMIRKCNVRMKKLNLHLLLIAFSLKKTLTFLFRRITSYSTYRVYIAPLEKKIVSNSSSFYFVKQRYIQSECKLNKKLNKKKISILHRRDTLPKSQTIHTVIPDSQSECKWNKNWIKGNKHFSYRFWRDLSSIHPS